MIHNSLDFDRYSRSPTVFNDFTHPLTRWVLSLNHWELEILDSSIYYFPERKGNNYYGYCTAGLSAEYSVDGYDVIMGVVGAKRGKGEARYNN